MDSATPPVYSEDFVPSDYYIFSVMGHTLAKQYFFLMEIWKNILKSGISRKSKILFNVVFMNCLKDEKYVFSEGKHFK